MKFEMFLREVKKLLPIKNEIGIIVIKEIIVVFEQCLSEKQKKRWNTELEMIKSYKSV